MVPLVIGIGFHGSMGGLIFWPLGALIQCTEASKNLGSKGPKKPWIDGLMAPRGQRTNQPMDQRTNQPMDQRTNQPMDPWTPGAMDQRNHGPMEII